MHHFRFIALPFFVLLVQVMAAPAFAQESLGGRPRFEVGIDVAAAAPDGDGDAARFIAAPRLTVNFSPRTALAVSADAFNTREYYGEFWEETHVVTADIRRVLLQRARFSMSGIFGGGFGWQRSFHPGFSYVVPGRDEVIVEPPSTRSEAGLEGTFGLGFQQRLTSHLALHQDVRLVLGVASEVRFQAGVSVPIGRYAPRFDPLRTRSGQRPDSLANGTMIGALVGAAAMGGFVAFLANALCEGECQNFAAGVAASAVYGAGPGALAGAIIDSYRD